MRIHKNEPSKLIQDLISVADELERDMKKFLIDGGYLHLVYTVDNKWCYIVLFASKKNEFEESNPSEMTLDDVRRFGDVIEEGECGTLLVERTSCINENCNPFYQEYLANYDDANNA